MTDLPNARGGAIITVQYVVRCPVCRTTDIEVTDTLDEAVSVARDHDQQEHPELVATEGERDA